MTDSIIKHVRCFGLIVCILNITRCSLVQHQNSLDCETYQSTIKATAQYKKDSALLNYTVYKWIDSCYGWFGHYNRRNAINGFYKVYVGDVFYDSAKLKLTAFVFVEYSTDYIDTVYEKVKNINAHLFDSHTIMGYRDSLNELWKLFELQEIFIGTRGISLTSAKKFHSNIFLNKREMGSRTIGVYDEKTGLNTKYEPVKYLPCEANFWTLSPLWIKGNRVLGYYSFETYMNATPLKKDIRTICKIDYPDSLLKLYK